MVTVQKTYESFEATVRQRYGDLATAMPLDVTLDASIDEVVSTLRDEGVVLAGLFHSIAMDKTIRVNGVRFSPYTGSKAGGAIPGLAKAEALCEELSPLGNARSEDLAAEVAYLLSPKTRITGDVRNVDGGYHIRG